VEQYRECVLDTVSDLVGKVEKRARKPWITQEMISKMNERRKWKNVNTEEGRKKYSTPMNEMERATDNAEKNILKTYATTVWNFKKQDVLI